MSEIRAVGPLTVFECSARGQLLRGAAMSAVIASLAPAYASAQEAVRQDSSAANIEEVVVTAQRREQSVQDVGISINVISGADVADMHIRRGTDVALMTPGVAATGTSGGFARTFSIRGVTQNDTSPHQEGPVAVYVDDVYVSSIQVQAFGMFDVERVEVLKGPQGTLFGRNATGGLVHILSRRPTPDFEGYGEVAFGSFNQVRAEGAVGGPITDRISARAAMLFEQHDPILDNAIGPDQMDSETIAGRVQVLFEPSDDLSILLNARAGQFKTTLGAAIQSTATIGVFNAAGQLEDVRLLGPNDTARTISPTGPTGVRPCAGCNFSGYRDLDGPGRYTAMRPIGSPAGTATTIDHTYTKMHGISGTLEWDVRDLTLTAISDYSRFETAFAQPLIGGGASAFSYYAGTPKIEQVSHEVRVSRDAGSWRGVLGAYYLAINGHFNQGFGFVPPGGGDTVFKYSQKMNSLSGFANIELELGNTLTIIGGLRYISEEKRFSFIARTFTGFTPTATLRVFSPSTSPFATQNTDLWSWRAGLNWRPGDDTLVYLSANRGVKAGGYNAPVSGFTTLPESAFGFKPEILLAYEAGIKQDLFEGRLTLNGSVFYYDYQDYQAALAIGTLRTVFNLQGRNYGGDFEAVVRPTPEWKLALGGSYTDALVEDVVINPSLTRDNVPTFTPKYKMNGLVRYTKDVGPGVMSGQVDAQYSSSYFLNILNQTALNQDDFVIVNANVDYELGPWTLSVFAKNVTDERYLTTGSDFTASNGEALIAYNEPRWLGVSARFSW